MANREKEGMSEMLSKLKAGTEITLTGKSPTHCESIRSLCYRVPNVYPAQRNKKYSCTINYRNTTIKIKVTTVKP